MRRRSIFDEYVPADSSLRVPQTPPPTKETLEDGDGEYSEATPTTKRTAPWWILGGVVGGIVAYNWPRIATFLGF